MTVSRRDFLKRSAAASAAATTAVPLSATGQSFGTEADASKL